MSEGHKGWKPSYCSHFSCQHIWHRLSQIWYRGASAYHSSVIPHLHPIIFISRQSRCMALDQSNCCPAFLFLLTLFPLSHSLPLHSSTTFSVPTSDISTIVGFKSTRHFSLVSLPLSTFPSWLHVWLFPPHSSLPLSSFLCRTMTLESLPL